MDKAQLEIQQAATMNDAAMERIKKETEAQAASEKVWFEDDETITLRDGSVRTIPPLLFSDARVFMQKVKTVDINAIIMNFSPGSDTEFDLFDIMGMAFKDHPDIVTRGEKGEYIVNREYLDRNVDIRIARKVIDIMLDVNGVKN